MNHRQRRTVVCGSSSPVTKEHGVAKKKSADQLPLPPEEIIKDYRLAYRSRQVSLIGRREVLSGKAKFGIFGDGKEVAQVALAKAFRPGDFRSGYYRDQTFMLAAGMMTLEELFAQLYANPDPRLEPASAGRQMTSHFATRTLDEDGDPIDVLICNTRPLVPGCVINVRPIGVLIMEDNAGQDEKVIAVPSHALTKRYDHILTISDLPEITVQQVEHFFEHYKDLEPGKWVKLGDWGDAGHARELIRESIERAGKT